MEDINPDFDIRFNKDVKIAFNNDGLPELTTTSKDGVERTFSISQELFDKGMSNWEDMLDEQALQWQNYSTKGEIK
jgi:hypothetical protein